jgi:hypothetical protein
VVFDYKAADKASARGLALSPLKQFKERRALWVRIYTTILPKSTFTI